MKAIARLVEPSSLISVHSLDVAPVSHSLNRLICQGFVGSRVDRKHLASEDAYFIHFTIFSDGEMVGGLMADNMAESNVKIGGLRFNRPISARVT